MNRIEVLRPVHTPRPGIDALHALSINHRNSPLALLERMTLAPGARRELHERFREEGLEAVVLSTCHRTELYCHAQSPEARARAEELWLAPFGDAPRDARFARMGGRAAGTHLFRTAAGLESMLLGEAEVLGQIRGAIESARQSGSAGPFLSRVFHASLRFGGRARSETGIGTGALSIASAAVRLLRGTRRDLSQLTVLVVGAGTTGLKVARHLKADGVGRLVLLNRTPERARRAAEELGAEAIALDQLERWLPEADAVVAAAHVESPLLTVAMLRATGPRSRGPLALVDLSLPRAIDPACSELPGIDVHNLSDLEHVVAENRERRETEIPRVEALLERELEQLSSWALEYSVRSMVSELRRRAESIRQEEVARALEAGGLDTASLDHVTRRLVDRLLHGPVRALREGASGRAEPHVRCLRQAFGIDEEGARDAG